MIIKRKSSAYQSGRIRGDWWKLKVDPLFLDVVIMYAQKGKGIRSGLFTDYTFGVWDGDDLVPIGKAYSGLTNDEIKQVGVEWCIKQSKELMKFNVPFLHYYSMGKSENIIKIAEAVF